VTALELLLHIEEEELKRIIKLEEEDDQFLPAEVYNDNYSRISAGIDIANEQLKYIMTILCCWHREEAHGENCQKEIDEMRQLSRVVYIKLLDENEEEIKASTKSWWNI